VLEPANAKHRAVLAAIQNNLRSGNQPTDAARISTLDVDSLAGNEPDPVSDGDPALIVTIGTRAARAALQRPGTTPVLSVFLPEAAYRQLTESLPGDNPGRTSGAIVLDQPVRRQIAIAHSLLPDARRIGALFSEPDGRLRKGFVTQAERFGLTANPLVIGEDDDPADGIERLMRDNELVVAVYDHRVFRPVTAKWMLYIGFQRHRPIVGFSYALLKAGAVAAVYSTPAQIGNHAAERIAAWLDHGASPGVEHPVYYSIGINGPVADALGIDVPDETAFGERVRRELEAAP
jgi:putative ABC transport system substrate-binding protein